MRRWQRLNQFWHQRGTRHHGRAFFFVEQLEGREVLSPVVVTPSFDPQPETLEGVSRQFIGDQETGGESFVISDSVNFTANYLVAATLRSTHGTFVVSERRRVLRRGGGRQRHRRRHPHRPARRGETVPGVGVHV